MEDPPVKLFVFYRLSGSNRVPAAIIRGVYKPSLENPIIETVIKNFDIEEIDLDDFSKSERKEIYNDIREVMEDPNQTEIIVGPKTILPFSGENESYFLMPNSSLRARGSLRKTESGITEIKNGLHTVFVNGNARAFILEKFVDIYVLKGTVAVDIDCKSFPEFDNIKITNRALSQSVPSNESLVSMRSLGRRKANSFRRRTSVFILYQSMYEQDVSKDIDLNDYTPIGYCNGNICRQEIVRDPQLGPLVSPQKRMYTVRFVLANLLDPKIKKDLTLLENTKKTCIILGSNDSSVTIFGCSGSGIMLAGYWCLTGITNQVQMINHSCNKMETNSLSDSDQVIVKLNQGSMQCIADLDCYYLMPDSHAQIDIEKHQPFDNSNNQTDDNNQ